MKKFYSNDLKIISTFTISFNKDGAQIKSWSNFAVGHESKYFNISFIVVYINYFLSLLWWLDPGLPSSQILSQQNCSITSESMY